MLLKYIFSYESIVYQVSKKYRIFINIRVLLLIYFFSQITICEKDIVDAIDMGTCYCYEMVVGPKQRRIKMSIF